MWLIIIILLLYFSGYGVIVSPDLNLYGMVKKENYTKEYTFECLTDGTSFTTEASVYSWVIKIPTEK